MSPDDTGPLVARRSVLSRLYRGETDFDVVGRMRWWFGLSGAAVLISVVSLFTQGLNLGIDFEGGVVWEAEAPEEVSVADVESAVGGFVDEANVQELSNDDGRRVRVQAESQPLEVQNEVISELAELTGTPENEVILTSVGPSWGDEITEKAIRALVIFLGLLLLYITVRFEFRMAVATIVALLHDLVITVGVYSVFQFPVTPATLVAVLTILGFSIYDGVVVFDRVNENTRLVSVTGKLTYRAMVNKSLNEVLMRTINTTITAVIPVLCILAIGSLALGATTLQEFGLALLVGLLAGTYSSILVASPLLVVLKEREPRYRDVAERIETRGAASARRGTKVKPSTGGGTATAVLDAPDEASVGDPDDAGADEGGGDAPRRSGRSKRSGRSSTQGPSSTPSTTTSDGPVQPRARKVKKRRR